MNPSDKSMDEFDHSSSSSGKEQTTTISNAIANANFSIKITVLVLLCFQNSGHALLTRYSRVSSLTSIYYQEGPFIQEISCRGFSKKNTQARRSFWLERSSRCLSLDISHLPIDPIQVSTHENYFLSSHILIICLILDAQGVGYRKLLWLTWNSQKIILLVFLYALSNLLAYYALARVDASAYTVLLQVRCVSEELIHTR